MVIRSSSVLAGLLVGGMVGISGGAAADEPETHNDRLAVMGCASFWPDTSNQDDVEASSGPGPCWGITYGKATTFGRMEFSIEQRKNELHNLNGKNYKIIVDGEELYVTSFIFSIVPEIKLSDRINAFAGFGVGVTYMDVLGNSEFLPSGKLKAGLDFSISPHSSIEIGYQYLYTMPVTVNDLELAYDSHGPFVAFVFRF